MSNVNKKNNSANSLNAVKNNSANSLNAVKNNSASNAKNVLTSTSNVKNAESNVVGGRRKTRRVTRRSKRSKGGNCGVAPATPAPAAPAIQGGRRKSRRMSKGASEWNKKMMEVYREMKKKDASTKLGDAMKEAARRKQRGEL
jgi:hypothetical protein